MCGLCDQVPANWTCLTPFLKQQNEEKPISISLEMYSTKQLKENDDDGRSFYYLDIVKVN